MKKTNIYTKFKVRLENEVLKEIINDNNCCTPEEFQRGENFAKRVAKILIKCLHGMHFKKKIRKKVYNLYLNGCCLEYIAFETNLNITDVDEIIDYMNEIYN